MSPIVDLPPRLIAGAAGLPPLTPGGIMGGGMPPPLPGQVQTEKINPLVDPRVKAMLEPAISKLGGVVKFSTLLGYATAARQTILYPEVVLSTSECQEYMSVGRCADPRCFCRHQLGAAPEAGKVGNFLTKMQPIVGYILNTPTEQLRRRVRSLLSAVTVGPHFRKRDEGTDAEERPERENATQETSTPPKDPKQSHSRHDATHCAPPIVCGTTTPEPRVQDGERHGGRAFKND
jgi:hypothetical protein